MGWVVTSFSIRENLKRVAERAIDAGLFPGITTLSGLIEHVLVMVLRSKGVRLELGLPESEPIQAQEVVQS